MPDQYIFHDNPTNCRPFFISYTTVPQPLNSTKFEIELRRVNSLSVEQILESIPYARMDLPGANGDTLLKESFRFRSLFCNANQRSLSTAVI